MTRRLPDSTDTPLAGHTLAQARTALRRRLRNATIPTPDLDARLLLQHATRLSHTALVAEERHRRLTATEAAHLHTMLHRRLTREPVSRIVGRRAFYGRDFAISPAVLDPRPETELLVEAALQLRPHIEPLHDGPPLLADIGTGSGCIIISVLAEWPSARGLAVDISADALAIARHNAIRHGVAERLLCLRANWLDAIGGPLDMLLSNPPYLSEADMCTLPPEVRHDPAIALAAGPDGLDAYRALAQRAAAVLRPGGWLLLEVGRGQAQAVRRMFEQHAFRPAPPLPPVQPDLAGIDRMVVLQRSDTRKN